ncbi:hypothetical protein D3C87_1522800 [compost metagenome]
MTNFLVSCMALEKKRCVAWPRADAGMRKRDEARSPATRQGVRRPVSGCMARGCALAAGNGPEKRLREGKAGRLAGLGARVGGTRGDFLRAQQR